MTLPWNILRREGPLFLPINCLHVLSRAISGNPKLYGLYDSVTKYHALTSFMAYSTWKLHATPQANQQLLPFIAPQKNLYKYIFEKLSWLRGPRKSKILRIVDIPQACMRALDCEASWRGQLAAANQHCRSTLGRASTRLTRLLNLPVISGPQSSTSLVLGVIFSTLEALPDKNFMEAPCYTQLHPGMLDLRFTASTVRVQPLAHAWELPSALRNMPKCCFRPTRWMTVNHQRPCNSLL